MAEFDVNQYELKGSFRIPRRSDAPAGVDSTGDKRSPLMVSSVASSKPIASRYGKKIVPAKRKQAAAPPNTQTQPVNATQPLDNILPAMMLPCTSQTAAKKKRHNSGGEADSGSMCSFPRGAAECQSSSSAALTRDRLQRHSASANSMVFRMKAGNSYHVGDSFASKGLMEALLAQKIRTGRIESHTQIRETLSKQRRLGGVDESAVSKRKSELDDEKKKGPRTPSGSPPPPAERRPPSPMEEGEAVSSEAVSSSSSSANRGRSLASSSSTTTPAEGSSPYKRSKHTVKETAAMVEGDAAEEATTGPVLRSDTEILGQIAGVAGVNVDRLKQMMSPEVLTVLRGVDSSILLATVSTVLSTIAKSVNKANVSTCSSSAAIDAKVEMNRKDDVTTTTNEVSSTSANPTAEEGKEEKAEAAKERPIEEDTQCEMELDSNSEDGEDAVAPAPTVARPNFNFPPPPLPICSDRPPPPPPPQERQEVQIGDQRERDELAVAGQPNQVQIIRTLLNALDIPSVSGQANQTSCHTGGASDGQPMGPPKPLGFPMPPVHLPPPSAPPCLPAVEPALVQPFSGLPPPLEKPPSPVLLDRYGMPLPTPSRRPRQNAPPPPFPAPLVRGRRAVPPEMTGPPPPPRISIPPPPMIWPPPAVVVGAPISVPFGSHAFIRPPTPALASFLPPSALQPPLPRIMRPQLNMFGPPPVRPDFRSHRPKKQRFRP